MARHLVVVESPAKGKTIKKYLGKDFEVLASFGHVRDLIRKSGAVDPNNEFSMRYEIIEKNARHVDAIIKALKKCDSLYLATDPDREGEAIAWHIKNLLEEKKALKGKSVTRISFNQVTKRAVKQSLEESRDISMDLVNAQQARRALDYLVGFTLSPLLWKKIKAGLSAGRVQSPALDMIVEREKEIEAFESKEYWSIQAGLDKDKQKFNARLTCYQNEKVEQFTVVSASQSEDVVATLKAAANGKLTVEKVAKKQRKRNPAAPFITSTLQQEAARKLGFNAQRTMRAAQKLYEEGHITYMRTDSVNLAEEAISNIRECIAAEYGDKNLPNEARVYKTKAKNAQEAHEAIRPTDAKTLPKSMKAELEADQYKLYNLIWMRTVASQMISATLDTVAVDFSCGDGNKFRANGSTLTDPGFMSVYQEDQDDKPKQADSEKILPPLNEGEIIDLVDIIGEQHFTEPPPRYSDASIIKALEEHGIGRPSTYASIISTLKARAYIDMDNKRFVPTDVGRIVAKFLKNYFTKYVDYGFTANLENSLDKIASGEQEWIPLLSEFWQDFKPLIDKIDETVQRSDVTQEAMDEKCPECQEALSIRLGRNGRFIGCTKYPDCKYTRNLDDAETEKANAAIAGRTCPKCSQPLTVKAGRYGKFIGCSGYPDCKHIEPLEKPKDTEVSCPQCKQATILQRKSRRGKIFYSCSRYPSCKYALWDEPLDQACPSCQWPITTIKVTKKRGSERVCPQSECHFREAHIQPDQEETDE